MISRYKRYKLPLSSCVCHYYHFIITFFVISSLLHFFILFYLFFNSTYHFNFFSFYIIYFQPENIVIKSFSRCEVKLIDFGSSCFTTDHLTSYIQSRSYRYTDRQTHYSYILVLYIEHIILVSLLSSFFLFFPSFLSPHTISPYHLLHSSVPARTLSPVLTEHPKSYLVIRTMVVSTFGVWVVYWQKCIR